MEGVLYGMALAVGGVAGWLLTMLAVGPECWRLRELLDDTEESVQRYRKRCSELKDRVTQLEGAIRRLSTQSQQIGQESRQALGGTLATPCGEREAGE